MRVHSQVDVITNSSTVIFTTVYGSAVESAYKALQAVLDIGKVVSICSQTESVYC